MRSRRISRSGAPSSRRARSHDAPAARGGPPQGGSRRNGGFRAPPRARSPGGRRRAAAGAALLFNAASLPRVAPHVLRVEERTTRFSVGITLYAVTVLLLILLFRRDLPIAAAGWGYLAFGDGFASIVGMTTGGRPSAVERQEVSVPDFAAISSSAFSAPPSLYGFVAARVPSSWELACLFCGALIGAAVESLPSELDDNVLPPLVGAAALALLLPCRAGVADALEPAGLRNFAVALAINVAVAALAGSPARRTTLGRAPRRAPRDRRARLRRRWPLRPPVGLLPRRHPRDTFPQGAEGRDRESRGRGRAARRGKRPRERRRAGVLRPRRGFGPSRRRPAPRGRRRARDGAHGHGGNRGRSGRRCRRRFSCRTSHASRRGRTAPSPSRARSRASPRRCSSRGRASARSSSRAPAPSSSSSRPSSERCSRAFSGAREPRGASRTGTFSTS